MKWNFSYKKDYPKSYLEKNFVKSNSLDLPEEIKEGRKVLSLW